MAHRRGIGTSGVVPSSKSSVSSPAAADTIGGSVGRYKRTGSPTNNNNVGRFTSPGPVENKLGIGATGKCSTQ